MSYEDDLRKFKEKTEREAERRYRAALLEVMSAVIMDTPVLEGRLRGDWEAFIGSGYSGTPRDRLDPSGSIALNAVTQVIRNVKVEDIVTFVNRLPYAEPIEYDGLSQKAPAGMLRKNLARWPQIVENDNA